MAIFLTNDEVERVITMSTCISAMETAYEDLGHNRALNMRRADMLMPTGKRGVFHAFKTMSGAVRSFGSVALRIRGQCQA